MLNLSEIHFPMPCDHDPHNPPKPRYTAHEDMEAASREMYKTIGRMLDFEKQLNDKVEKMLSLVTSDNVTFKETFNNAYRVFLEDVRKEVNGYESNMDSAFRLFTTTIEHNYASLSDDCKAQISEYYNDIILHIKNNINGVIKDIIVDMQEDGTIDGVITSQIYIIPQFYGAKGDGVADDTAAIQQAINENNGKRIYFPDGIYNISKSINMESNYCCLELAPNAVIRATANMNDMLYFSRTAEENHQYIKGGIWDANGKAKNCIHVKYVANLHILEMVLMNALEKHVYLEDGYEIQLYDLRIDNRLAYQTNPNVVGIYLDSTDSNISQIVAKNCTTGFVFNESVVADRIHPWCNKTDRFMYTIGVDCNARCEIINSEIDNMFTGVRLLNYYDSKIINTKIFNGSNYNSQVTNNSAFIVNDTAHVYLDGCTIRNWCDAHIKLVTNGNFYATLNNCMVTGNFDRNVEIAKPVEFKDYRVVVSTAANPLTIGANAVVQKTIDCNDVRYTDCLFLADYNGSSPHILVRVFPEDKRMRLVFYNLSNTEITLGNVSVYVVRYTKNSMFLSHSAEQLNLA